MFGQLSLPYALSKQFWIQFGPDQLETRFWPNHRKHVPSISQPICITHVLVDVGDAANSMPSHSCITYGHQSLGVMGHACPYVTWGRATKLANSANQYKEHLSSLLKECMGNKKAIKKYWYCHCWLHWLYTRNVLCKVYIAYGLFYKEVNFFYW